MANVRFIKTTKQRYLSRDTYDPTALYFCEDTGEMFKGNVLFTDGIRIVPTKADLPECPCAADGVVYYIAETKSGYMMSPDRTEWLQTIYAPVADVTSIPESEIYNTVTTVGAVRDIENALYSYIDQEIADIEVSGSNGLSAYEIWLNEGHTGTESDFLNWLKGEDGKDGKDGLNGADGKSAYEIWLGAGHTGSEEDFLQWLKGDTEPFGDVVTSIGFEGIAAGTSLKGKTVKDVLVMLLGIQEAAQSVVEYIMQNYIPAYIGSEGAEFVMVDYQHVDAATVDYTEQGFYTSVDGTNQITNAGYQMVFPGNAEMIAQTFAIYSEAKIITAHKYEPVLNQWIDMDFDDTYWIETGKMTKVIDGKEVEYTTYAYNVELMGDAITATEYWRFEVEV